MAAKEANENMPVETNILRPHILQGKGFPEPVFLVEKQEKNNLSSGIVLPALAFCA